MVRILWRQVNRNPTNEEIQNRIELKRSQVGWNAPANPLPGLQPRKDARDIITKRLSVKKNIHVTLNIIAGAQSRGLRPKGPFSALFAHAAFDLTALAMIYWNLESTVAHLLFK
jgi:hypothetical protein